MPHRPRIPNNRDKDYDYANQIIKRDIYLNLHDFVKRLDSVQEGTGEITGVQANQILADGIRALTSENAAWFTEEHKHLIAVMTMVESLAGIKESLVDQFMNEERERQIWKTGYRKRTDSGFKPDPEKIVDEHTISREEKVLEALRDRFPGVDLAAISYVKSQIGGEGEFHILIPYGANPFNPMSRDLFAKELKIHKEKMGRGTVGKDPDDLVLILPEQDTIRALGMPQKSIDK